MARGAWIYDPETDKLVPKGEYLRLKAQRAAAKVSALSRPYVICSMPAIKCMADGKYYDDKRSYQKAVARAGCEVVGFDKNWTDYIGTPYNEKAHEADIVADVKKSLEQLTSL